MYCTANDIINELGYKVASQLTDASTPDNALIEEKILEAEEFINSRLEGVFELPLKNSHSYIKVLTIELVKFLMKKKRLTIDKLDDSFKWIEEMIKNLSTGEADLFGETRKNPFLESVGFKSTLKENFWTGYDN